MNVFDEIMYGIRRFIFEFRRVRSPTQRTSPPVRYHDSCHVNTDAALCPCVNVVQRLGDSQRSCASVSCFACCFRHSLARSCVRVCVCDDVRCQRYQMKRRDAHLHMKIGNTASPSSPLRIAHRSAAYQQSPAVVHTNWLRSAFASRFLFCARGRGVWGGHDEDTVSTSHPRLFTSLPAPLRFANPDSTKKNDLYCIWIFIHGIKGLHGAVKRLNAAWERDVPVDRIVVDGYNLMFYVIRREVARNDLVFQDYREVEAALSKYVKALAAAPGINFIRVIFDGSSPTEKFEESIWRGRQRQSDVKNI